MQTALTTQRYPLAVDEFGNLLDIAEGQAGYLVRRQSGGRPGIEYYLGTPLIVHLNATRQDVIDKVKKAGTLRLYPVNEDGDEIHGAPVAILEITPEEVGQGADVPHWMRLDRVFDALDRSMTAMESKDVLLGQITRSLIENNTALHEGAVRLLDTANTTINVANGIERPELDIDGLSRKMVSEVQSARGEHAGRDPWFVMLLNGEWGKGMLEFANNLAGWRKPTREGE